MQIIGTGKTSPHLTLAPPLLNSNNVIKFVNVSLLITKVLNNKILKDTVLVQYKLIILLYLFIHITI